MAKIILEEIIPHRIQEGFRVLREESAARLFPLASFTLSPLRKNQAYVLIWEEKLSTGIPPAPIDVVRKDHLPQRRAYRHALAYAKKQVMEGDTFKDKCKYVGELSCRHPF